MREFRNDNDYSVSVFNENRFLIKVGFVHNLYAFTLWLDSSSNYKSWTYMNVYIRRSKRFLRQYRKGNYIPSKPRS